MLSCVATVRTCACAMLVATSAGLVSFPQIPTKPRSSAALKRKADAAGLLSWKADDEVDAWGDVAMSIITSVVRGIRYSQPAQRRVVFFAGVEGTGHHLLQAIYKQITEKPEVAGTKLEAVAFPRVWGCGMKWQEGGKQEMTETFEQLNSSNVVWTLPQQASYPECGVGDVEDNQLKHDSRAYDYHPRLDWIEQVATATGTDLHVILLYRPLIDCLIADCQHRHFEPCQDQADTLQSNAGFLVDQIKASFKEPGNVHCFRYGDHESMHGAVNGAYGKTNPNMTREVLNEVWRPHKKSSAERESMEKMYASKLAEADATLLELCRLNGL